MPASLAPWGHLLGALTLDVALIFAAAFVSQRLVRGALWHRTIWQAALLGCACVLMVEVGGLKRLTGMGGVDENSHESPTKLAFQTSTEATPNLAALVERLKQQRQNAVGTSVAVAPVLAWWPGSLWLLGGAVVATWMVLARLAFVFFMRRRTFRDEAVLRRTESLSCRMGLHRRVAITEAPGLAGPIAFGIFRPGVSLPEGFARRFSATQQEAMLAHELAHLAARDPLWHALADVLAALLWWHPLVWLARRQLRAASEAAADEASLLVENGPVVLAECLVELGGRLTRTRSLGWLGMEGSEFRSGLGRRVKELVRMPGRSWKPIPSGGSRLARSIGVLALVTLVLGATSWLSPREGKADTFRQAFQQSIVGLALAAAQPDPQVEVKAADEVPVTAPSLVEEARFQNYEIRAGDTLSRIVVDLRQQRLTVTQAQIVDANPGVTWNQLRIGQRIRVPAAQGSPADPGRAQIAGGAPAPEPDALHTRWFKIDSTAVGTALQGWLGTNAVWSKTNTGGEALLADLGRLLGAAGVEIAPPEQMLVNERSGMLMVRATLQDLDAVERVIQTLNAGPAQVTLEVRLCEFTEEAGRELAQDPILAKGILSSTSEAIRSANTNDTAQTAQAILTEEQYRAVMKTLESRAGVDVLTTPKVTTLSGRQAQIKTVNIRYVVTDLDISSPPSQPTPKSDPTQAGKNGVAVGGAGQNEATTFQPLAQPFELGPVIDLVPYVAPDNATISLTVIASIKEFLGYENLEGLVAAVKAGNAAPQTQIVPLPNFRFRQVIASAKVHDGQTLVLAGGSIAAGPIGEAGAGTAGRARGQAGSAKKSLLVFVTPTLIDAAGNRLSER